MGKITNGWFALGCATGLLACAPATEAAQAKIADWNGTPAIIVDGKPVPPMLMTMTEWDIGDYERPYFKRLGEAGLRVFFVTVRSDWQLPPDAAKGEIGGILDISEFGTPLSCYFDQDSDLQDELGAKLARLYNCGFEYAYFLLFFVEDTDLFQDIHGFRGVARVFGGIAEPARFK